jgi:hypothetical protein
MFVEEGTAMAKLVEQAAPGTVLADYLENI